MLIISNPRQFKENYLFIQERRRERTVFPNQEGRKVPVRKGWSALQPAKKFQGILGNARMVNTNVFAFSSYLIITLANIAWLNKFTKHTYRIGLIMYNYFPYHIFSIVFETFTQPYTIVEFHLNFEKKSWFFFRNTTVTFLDNCYPY